MKNTNKSKLLISIILLIVFSSHLLVNAASLPLDPVLPTAPESAPPVSPVEHKRTIENYINRLRSMHNRAFQLVQLTLDTPPRDIVALRQSINSIRTEIISIRREMRDYLTLVQTTGIQSRDILLIFNSLNHISNQLFYLEELSVAPSNVEKVIYLEDFFRSRSAASDTLRAIEEFILRN